MDAGRFRFGSFMLDRGDRQLISAGQPVDLNGRYLDALALLVATPGELVTKDRFMSEVWRGVPVTDEALTQCIRTLRRTLGDDAANPRFIATVPKYGYRFVAPVTNEMPDRNRPAIIQDDRIGHRLRDLFAIGGGGTLGGAVAGVVGGLAYGFEATAQPVAAGMGAISVVLVIVAITTLVATIGATGVAFGIALARTIWHRSPAWSIAGGALGGLVVGALVKLLGLDAFDLLFSQSPGNITGGAEGLLLGGAVGLGCWLAIWRDRAPGWRRGLAWAAFVGSIAGMAIPLLGGRMMGASLDLLTDSFPASRLDFAQLGRLFGESDFGIVSRTVTGGLEGALFAACIVGGILFVDRRFGAADIRQA